MAPKQKKKVARARTRKESTSDIEDELPLPGPPRPFNNVEGLPLSIEEPEYGLLNNPLSLKDSAVLYSSLMKSRRAYVSGNIFDLYWAKGKTKFDNDTNARDRMNKLSDCGMEIGPHSFDVRFFILKDDEIEKKRQEEKDKKKEKRIANKKLREEKKKKREVKKAAQMDDINITTGNPDAPTPTQTPDVEKDEAEEDDDSSSSDENEDDDDENGDAAEEEGDATAADASEIQNTEQSEQPETEPHSAEPERAGPEEEVQTPNDDTKPLPPLQLQTVDSKDKPETLTETDSTKKSTKKPKLQAKVQVQTAATPADPMQTPESQMMIANLNAIARVDPSLNSLMKIVATGNAKPEQIREFQGYIQRAKAMGPSPHFKQPVQSSATAPATTTKTKAPKAKTPKPPKPPKKLKPPKEKLLTTFQELYVSGADLVFEFSENPNVRFNLPKDCVIEKTGPNEILVSFLVIHNRDQIYKFRDRQKSKKERLEKLEKEKGEPAKDGQLAQEPEPEPESEKELEGEEKLELEGEEPAEEQEKTSKRVKRGRPRNVQRKVKKEDKSVDTAPEIIEEPIPYYSAISFKLTSVSSKYDPIFINSFNKYESVKAQMEKVLEEGIRVPKTFVWYSVDSYEDEELAEGLRHQLYLIENPPKGKYKKRSMEDSLILNKPGTLTAKKAKTE